MMMLQRCRRSWFRNLPQFMTPLLRTVSSKSPMATTMTTPPNSTRTLLKKPVKLACVQLASGKDKAVNLENARSKVLEAAKQGAGIIILPECFNSPYGCDYFSSYAETLVPSPPPRDQSPSFHALSSMAAEARAYLVGGSIPEAERGPNGQSKNEAIKHYNTSLIFGPDGSLLGRHRKVHLFDIDIPGGITFRESDVLSPGNKITLVDLPEYGRIAVAICYDVRFPELATIAARHGAFALVYPGAFNLVTGPMHWKLLAQARALDNQIYVAMCSPARNMSAKYHAWGHSLIVDPQATVVVEAGEEEGVVSWVLDDAKLNESRRSIPLGQQRRFDVYPDISQGKVRLSDPDDIGDE